MHMYDLHKAGTHNDCVKLHIYDLHEVGTQTYVKPCTFIAYMAYSDGPTIDHKKH